MTSVTVHLRSPYAERAQCGMSGVPSRPLTHPLTTDDFMQVTCRSCMRTMYWRRITRSIIPAKHPARAG